MGFGLGFGCKDDSVLFNVYLVLVRVYNNN